MAHGIAGSLVLATASLLTQTTPAQTPPPADLSEMPAGLFRGSFVTWSGTPSSGNLTIRTSQGGDLFCSFDSHSYMERDHWRISVSSLNSDDKLEILADHKPGSSTCYARTVAVIDAVAERVAAERARQANSRPTAARPPFFTPAGDRTLSGVVTRITSFAVTLRTRAGETTLALRPDTRYLEDGVRADATALRVNARIFVRAGKTIEGVLEAYQVMWGAILDIQ